MRGGERGQTTFYAFYDLKSVNERIDVRDGYKRFFDLSVIITTHTLLCPRWLIVWIFVPLAIKRVFLGPDASVSDNGAETGQTCSIMKVLVTIAFNMEQRGVYFGLLMYQN